MASHLSAQNWNPIHFGNKYIYVIDFFDISTAHAIYIDSFKTVNNDSVFYLNTIAKKIDSQSGCLRALRNQPLFLNKKMIKKQNGNIYFTDTVHIFININAKISEFWLFDSLQNISAKIISNSYKEVLGIFDSVKTILLSTYDTVIIGKSLGIIKYPKTYYEQSYYNLVGIKGKKNIGNDLLVFKDIYNFDVGDKFEYYHEWYYGPNCAFCGSMIEQYTIITKFTNGDTIKYDIRNANGSNNSLNYIDEYNSILNKYKDEPIFNGFTYYLFNITLDTLTNRMMREYDFYIGYISERSVSDTMSACSPGGGTYENYVEGLGLTYQFSFGAGSSLKKLVAYKKKNDSLGTFTPIEELTGLETPNNLVSPFDFLIYPLPANENLWLQITSRAEQFYNVEFQLFEFTGKLLFQRKIFQQNSMIELSDLSSGIYLYLIKDKHGLNRRGKIIITR